MQELVACHGVTKGRVRLSLAAGEHHAGLTINEYETLLMRHDLIDVLRDPLRFVAEKGRRMWANPRAIPARTLEYAKSQFVRVFNEVCDALHMGESLVERVIARLLGIPARRFFRMQRSVSSSSPTTTRPASPRLPRARTSARFSSNGVTRARVSAGST